jgi:hypothetical protein
MRTDCYKVIADHALGKNETENLALSPKYQPGANQNKERFKEGELGKGKDPAVPDHPEAKEWIHLIP